MKNIYLEIQEKLLEASDDRYKNLTAKFIPNVSLGKMLGIRTPILRNIAKNIAKNSDWKEYILNNKNEYFEEILLEGLIIGYVKIDLNTKFNYIKNFVNKINNWATCDMFCSTLKFKNDEKKLFLDFILPYSKSEKEFEIRFFVVMLKILFIEKDYINYVLKLLDSIKTNYYYTQMGIAWTLSDAYIKFPDITIEYFKNCNLDKFTYNKALQKIVESNRVTKENKMLIKSMKRT